MLILGNQKNSLCNELFFVKKIREGSTIRVLKNHTNKDEFIASSSAILASQGELDLIFDGEWIIEKISIKQIIIFSLFLNYRKNFLNENINEINKGSDLQHRNNEPYFFSIVDSKYNSFIELLSEYIIQPNSGVIHCLFSFIYSIKEYWINSFILLHSIDKSIEQSRIYDICESYGISESYFRKLCHKVFTCSGKKQLRMWRGAVSVLELIENEESISITAVNNGYSSSSHFSSEVKSLFGFTPKKFKNLEGLFNEQFSKKND